MTRVVERLAEDLTTTRERTLALVRACRRDTLSEPAAPFMGPILWDLGHLAWFEELWLLRRTGLGGPADERLDRVYDAMRSPRSVRSELPLPTLEQALAYLAEVRSRVLDAAERLDERADGPLLRDGYVFRMVVQHEIQHQETMLQSMQLSGDPAPLGLLAGAGRGTRRDGTVDDHERAEIPGGAFAMGTDVRAGTYDNERPARAVHAPPFALDVHPVTNRRYEAFVRDGGYERRELWTADGWDWRASHGVALPAAWVAVGERGFGVFRFGIVEPLEPEEPVQHVSWFEADAFARWSGARLPTEAEWEKAASWDASTGRSRRHPWGDEPAASARANVGWKRPGPAPVGSHPDGASPCGVRQLLGDVYEWTSSDFAGHDGFVAFPYREYSEAFFGGGYKVLRGGSFAVHDPLVRASYRNWDLPGRRQLFAGIRLAWDLR